MPKKWYPTKAERKALHLKTRNHKVRVELKTLEGLIKFFQEHIDKPETFNTEKEAVR